MAKMFELPTLPYAYNALEPVIDAKTMEIHHQKHHGGYVNNLNNALKDHPHLLERPVEEILRGIHAVPENIRTTVRNNAGGHANHTLWWELIAPGGSKGPSENMDRILKDTFESTDKFKDMFNEAASTRFGSGWAWLVLDERGKLRVYSTPNQDSPLMDGHIPVIGLDVWEHAYYLTYQNRRMDYIKAFWTILNWDAVDRNLVRAQQEREEHLKTPLAR